MPTYEYRCEKCNQLSKELQKITDSPLTDCPQCGEKNSLRRGPGGGIGLSFSGSGFYATDYAQQKTEPTNLTPQTSSTSKTKCGSECKGHCS